VPCGSQSRRDREPVPLSLRPYKRTSARRTPCSLTEPIGLRSSVDRAHRLDQYPARPAAIDISTLNRVDSVAASIPGSLSVRISWLGRTVQAKLLGPRYCQFAVSLSLLFQLGPELWIRFRRRHSVELARSFDILCQHLHGSTPLEISTESFMLSDKQATGKKVPCRKALRAKSTPPARPARTPLRWRWAAWAAEQEQLRCLPNGARRSPGTLRKPDGRSPLLALQKDSFGSPVFSYC